MVAEKVRKNCIGKHGENKHEEPGPTTEETVIKPRSCSCEMSTLRCNKVKFLSQVFNHACYSGQINILNIFTISHAKHLQLNKY